MPTMTDPVEALIAADERRDHSQARQRGELLASAVSRIVSELHATGLVRADRLGDVKVVIGSLLCDEFYRGRAVDVPDWRRLK